MIYCIYFISNLNLYTKRIFYTKYTVHLSILCSCHVN